MPYNATNVGVCLIEVSLSDGYLKTSYTFRIVVEPLIPPSAHLQSLLNCLLNIGPPVFISSLKTLEIAVGTTLVY